MTEAEPSAVPTPLPAPDAAVADVARVPLRGLELRAALLLILMALLVGAAVLYLMWVRGAFEATQKLYLSADDSEGVVVGMDMSFSGFPIGRVSRIELAEQGSVRIHVDVPVKSARWLRTSSVFTLEKGLVGAARLRAFSGILDDPPLPPGAERIVLRGDVSAEIPKMVADARDVLLNLNRLTGEQSALYVTLGEVQRFTRAPEQQPGRPDGGGHRQRGRRAPRQRSAAAHRAAGEAPGRRDAARRWRGAARRPAGAGPRWPAHRRAGQPCASSARCCRTCARAWSRSMPC
jgi:hypothetical protein